MSEQLKNEIKLFLMYLSIAILSRVIEFFLYLSYPRGNGELANAININEAWKTVHLLQPWFLFFVVCGIIRLIFVGFFKKGKVAFQR
jgi:hypothetical protein